MFKLFLVLMLLASDSLFLLDLGCVRFATSISVSIRPHGLSISALGPPSPTAS